MEPVTHLLTGACLARTGLNRKAAYATVTTALAAEMPDIDTAWSWRGPVEGFAHHRGITHTFLALPFEAAILVALVYGVHRFRLWRSGRRSGHRSGRRWGRGAGPAGAPLAWGWLYGFAMLGLLSHLLLDYTNNYGLRPFFPFDSHWYAGSFVFIFDPLIFVLLVAALVAPVLFGLVGSEVGARKAPFRGQGWAVGALFGILMWWSLRFVEHAKAVDLAMGQSVRAPERVSPDESVSVPESAPLVYLTPLRVLASPEPFNPFRWSTATDFGAAYQMADVDLLAGNLLPVEPMYPKPTGTAEILAAEGSPLGRAYMDWSSMPLLDVNRAGDGSATVTFRDLRFVGGWMGEHGRSALVGRVRLDTTGHVVAESMDERTEPQR